MLRKKIDLFFVLIIALVSFLLVADLFINKGQPATFDGTTHITTIAQFYRGMSEGELRVTWGDGFANYGMPIPLISQQLSANTGSILNFLFNDVVTSFNFVFLLGAFLSSLFYYLFLRIYFTPLIAFAGTFLLNFAPYRIINIYIRGAQPEFFAGIFIPLILIGIYLIVKKKNSYGLLLTSISVALLVLSHPFMLVVSSFVFAPYIIFCIYDEKNKIKNLIKIITSIAIGIGLTSYYTLPLFSEIKYFNYGVGHDPLIPNQFLTLPNFFDPNWYYFYKNDTFVRGNFIKVDLLESTITIIGILLWIYLLIKKKNNSLLKYSVLSSITLIFLTLSQSEFIYQNIKLLKGIQYPWRLLGGLIFITPLIACILLQKFKYQKAAAVILIVLVAFLRFPHAYGKNYATVHQSEYFFTKENLHGNILNTVWTGKTTEYPIKKQKPEIISGQGEIAKMMVKNSERAYEIKAAENIRMADYTFYFPGWNVYVDGKKTPIQFQDPNYRGVITYDVPKGNHNVFLKFENTKIRILGNISTVFFVILSVLLFLYDKKARIFYSAIPKAWRK